MRKMIRLIKRRRGLDPIDFQRRWASFDTAALVSLPGLASYIQSHPLLGGYRRSELVFDGVEEIWLRDEVADEKVIERLTELHGAIVDEPGTIALPIDVHVIRDGAAPRQAIKSFELVNRRGDLGLATFRDYWRTHHGPLACDIPFARYEQNHVADGGYAAGEPVYDGLATTWFGSIDAMRATVATDAYHAIRADEPNFLATPLPVLLTRERLHLEPV